MTPLPIVVLGTGHLGRIHARLLKNNPDFALVGVVDPVAEAREAVSNALGVAAFADLRDVREPFSAAVIATPTRFHHEVALPLLARGTHLFIEKPITLDVSEADELIAAARTRQLTLQVGHVERFNPAFAATRSQLVEPRFLEAVRASGYTFRSTDVGVVLDLMIHDLDLILSLADSPVTAVDAVGSAVLGPHEDVAHARLRFANGCLANLSASRVNHQQQRTLRFFSDRLFASLDFAAGSAEIIRPDERLLRRELNVATLSPDEKTHLKDHLYGELLHREPVTIEKSNAIQDEHRDFLTSIRDGRSPRVPGEAGREALAVAEEITRQIHAPRHTIVRPRIAA